MSSVQYLLTDNHEKMFVGPGDENNVAMKLVKVRKNEIHLNNR